MAARRFSVYFFVICVIRVLILISCIEIIIRHNLPYVRDTTISVYNIITDF